MERRQKKSRQEKIPSPSISRPGMKTASLVLTIIAVVIFILSRIYILSDFQPLISDMPLYFNYAAVASDLHKTPYKDDFKIEYPPLAWWTIYAPRTIDSRVITSSNDRLQVESVLTSYRHAFRGLMFLFDLASFFMIIRIVRKRRPELTGWAALLYAITTAWLAHLLYDRLDIGMLFFLMSWAFCWTRSLQDSGRVLGWTTAAYAMIGLGVSFKIIPVICIPFLLLAEAYMPRFMIRLTYAVIALAATICLPFIFQYAVSGPGVFDFFTYHAEREIQLESLYSTLMMICSYFGSQVFVDHSHGAFNLGGDLSHPMKIFASIMLFAFLACMGLWALVRRSNYSREDAYRFTCYVVPSSVILSNVLSPQYFIWAFPLMILSAVDILPKNKILPWILGSLLMLVTAMTTWLFPYHYFYEPSNTISLLPKGMEDQLPPTLIAYVVLGLRNFTYLGIIIWLGVLLIRRTRKSAEVVD